VPRLSVNVNDETAAALHALADKHGCSVTEIVRRAVSAQAFFARAQREGKRITLSSPQGTTEVTFL
jgi:hypothetical protein